MSLLDDPDPEIQAHIQEALIEAGKEAVPLLEQYWWETQDPALRQRIEELLEAIQLEWVGKNLYEWRLKPEQPLFPALMYVAQLRYPSLEVSRYVAAYRRLVHTTWLQLPQQSEPIEKILTINQHLFLHERFQAEKVQSQASRYFFLHHVLETRRGNSFSLSTLYYLVTSELGLSVSLIQINTRYLVRYFDGNLHFYIDPYQHGFLLLPSQLKALLGQMGLSENLAHYTPLSPPYLVLRLIRHLEQAYEREGDIERRNLYAALREKIDIKF